MRLERCTSTLQSSSLAQCNSTQRRTLCVRAIVWLVIGLAPTQCFSAVRYCHIPSETKHIVDKEPAQWTSDGKVLDLFAESQEPFVATAWKRRREEREKAVASGEKKAKGASFSKLDLTAIIIDQSLKSNAAIMSYAQANGTHAMHTYVHHHQRKLQDILEDAEEWKIAQASAMQERASDWELVCRAADGECPHGASCKYAEAVDEIFRRNCEVLSKQQLAVAVRAIIMQGPSKTTRTPLIVGPTNIGKSTLVLPFDDLFGHKQVFHKPALGSKFALRNMMKGKRFLFWDDFRPVQYAQATIPTATVLSLFTGHPFEVQVSQSFHDGNVDFAWHQGAVLTAKEQGLWQPCSGITEEDVRHMQSRFDVFRCVASVSKMSSVGACPHHMAKWIRDSAAAHDTRVAMQAPLALLVADGTAESHSEAVEGMAAFLRDARVPREAGQALERELLGLGAIHTGELAAAEWKELRAWALLLPLEQRRLLQCLQ